MPNFDFYGVGQDHKVILDFILSLNDCDVYELSSPVDQSIAQFRTSEDVRNWYQIKSWDIGADQSILLQIYPRAARGEIHFEKILFSSQYNGPGKFRYTTVGWGLIQLYLEPQRNHRLSPSHTNHKSEKRARAWEHTCPNLGLVANWNWPSVERWSRRLNRFIQRCSTAKVNNRVVLAAAKQLNDRGVQFDLNLH